MSQIDKKHLRAFIATIALIPTLGFVWEVAVTQNRPVLLAGLNSLSFIAILVAVMFLLHERELAAVLFGALHPLLYALARTIHDRQFHLDFAFWTSVLLFVTVMIVVIRRLRSSRAGRGSGSQ